MKQNNNIIRIAAVLYADDNQNVSALTILRKIVEAILFDYNNKELSNHELIDNIQNSLKLTFSEDEIVNIVENSDAFEVRQDISNNDIFYLRLTEKRFQTLVSKVETNSLEYFIEKFIRKIYKNDISSDDLKKVLYKYIYELINSNISAFNKIVKAKNRTKKIIVDANLFQRNERKAINTFLSWDNNKKNKALFDVISYSIEYCLITNNLTGDNVFVQSIKTKIFYLDNNIIYRALGINGRDRKNRLTTFLDKCVQNGQKLYISKYTYKEFNQTIDYHVERLKEVPSGKINPDLFDKYDVSPGFYEYYHNWRKAKQNSSYTIFRSYIQSEYKRFLKKYDIQEDFKIPYDEKDKIPAKTIEKYIDEIKKYKIFGNIDSHKFDALNTYLVEQKREHNNISIADTKYFFVSTDQKLRDWDFDRNDFQPIALLPSQWLSILLKYVSRTDDDYKSFVSFIKLKHTEKTINKDDIHVILSGISEITEEFDLQEEIFDFIMNRRLDEVINKKSTKEKINKIRTISKDFIENKYEEENIALKNELENAKEEKNNVENDIKQFKNINEENLRKELLQNNELIKNIVKLKSVAEKEANKVYKGRIFLFFSIIIAGYIAIEVIIKIAGWDFMEPKTWSIGAIAFIFGLLYMAIHGENANPLKYFKNLKERKKEEAYEKYDFSENRLNELINRNKEIEKT